ncbi:E3 SUMO-protein ligase ZBED1 [Frankliniella fusca]|uniref:E3 SUMO-protein ligase ZBED1 n=1 Tax=Frankliniella fusca TaxID=407009 RepID=A0AAE1LY85_9NEOP|nr:E3 SUMO-protein ligase ZBED1 [Frankliniella fusca]
MRVHLEKPPHNMKPNWRKTAQSGNTGSNVDDDDDEEMVDDVEAGAAPPAKQPRQSEQLMSPPSSPAPCQSSQPESNRPCPSPGPSPSASRSRSSTPPSRPGSQTGFRGPLDRCLSNATAFAAGGYKDEEVTSALAFMVCRDSLPLRTPEREGFRAYSRRLNPLYKVPAEPKVTSTIEKKYTLIKQEVGELIAAADSYSLTYDLWTQKYTMKGFLGKTIHFAKDDELISVELAAHPMPQRKTKENLVTVMSKLCEDWNIDTEKVSAVVTDGGANIRAAVKDYFGAEKHVSCFAHALNGIGQTVIELHSKRPVPTEVEEEDAQPETEIPENEEDIDDPEDANQGDDEEEEFLPTSLKALLKKVKRIVLFFRSSEVASNDLQAFQVEAGIPKNKALRLIQEVRTRWNSCYDMVSRFLHLSDFVSRVLFKVQREKSSKRKPPPMLSADELEALTEVAALLKPLAVVTAEVSTKKTVSLSKVIPLTAYLKTRASSYEPNTIIGQNVKHTLLTQVEEKFDNIERNPLYAAATLLDPRFKKVPFSSPAAAKAAEREVGRLVSDAIAKSRANERAAYEAAQEEQVEPQRAQPVAASDHSGETDDPWSVIDEKVRLSNAVADRDRAGGLPIELRQYLNRPPMDRKSNQNPLKAWKSISGEYPHVWKIAQRILSITATSVPCERLFSHAGIIGNQLRTRLSGEHLDMLVFLRSFSESQWFDGVTKI